MAERYWRVVGLATRSGGRLQLTGAELWIDGTRTTFPVSCTLDPVQGSVANLSVAANTDVVEWDATTVAAPGFAMVWDTLSASTTRVGLKLKSAASADAYPRNLVIQSSPDLITWTTEQTYNNLTYPGDNAGSEFSINTDLQFASVALSLGMDGANGSTTFIDAGPQPKAVSVFGNARLSTAMSKFGSSSGYFDGVSDYLAIGEPSDWAFLHDGSTWTCEGWFSFTNLSADRSLFSTTATTIAYGMCIYTSATTGRITVAIYRGVDSSLVLDAVSSVGVTADSQFHHIAVTYDHSLSSNNCKIFIDGDSVGAATKTGNTPAPNPPTNTLHVAAYGGAPGLGNLNGYADDIRITKGVARYTASFLPPQSAFGGDWSGATTHQFASGMGSWSVAQSMYGGTGATAEVVNGVLTPTSFGVSANSRHGPIVSKAIPPATDFDITYSGVNFSTAPSDIVSMALSVGVPEDPLRFWFWMNDAWDSGTTGLEGWYFASSSGTIGNTVFTETLVNAKIRLVRTGNLFKGFFNDVEVHSSACNTAPVSEISIQFLSYANFGVNEQSVAAVTISSGASGAAMRVTYTDVVYAPSPVAATCRADGDVTQVAGLQLGDGGPALSEVQYAGPGKIVGTVFEKGSPSNLAVRRKVRLHDERSGMLVQEAWSDATTGAYQFTGIPTHTRYTVIGYDHTGAYRGVIADGQLAERMV